MATPTSEKTNSVFQSRGRQDAIWRKIQWRILPFLVVCYIVAFIDRSNIGFAKLEFSGDLGFSDAVYGLGASLFYLGYILFEVPSNLLLHKVGVRKTFLRIMIPWGLVAAVTAFMTVPGHYYVLRFLLGVTEAGFFPGVLLYLTYWIPSGRRAKVMAIFLASIAVSGVIGGPISGVIMHAFDGVLDLAGWQWVFIIEGLPACLLGVTAYILLSDRPAQAKWLSDEERDFVATEMEADQPKGDKVPHSYGAALRNKSFWGMAALGFGIMTSTSGLFLWVPTIIKQAGHTGVLAIGLISAIPFLVAVVFQYLNARHSDKVMERRRHAGVAAVIGAAGWVVLPLVSDMPWVAIVVLTVIATGTMAAMGPFWSMPPALLRGTAAAGGIATITAFAGIGNLITPAVSGWISATTGSLNYTQLMYGLVLGVGALVMFTLIKHDTKAGV